MKRTITRIVTTILILYTGACAYLYFFQRSILYLPSTNLEAPEKYELSEAKLLKIKTSDDVEITAWYIEAKPGYPTLAYFHGNAGNLGRRAEKFKDFT